MSIRQPGGVSTPPAIASEITDGTPGSVLFVGGTTAAPTFSQDNQGFIYNDSLNRLSVFTTLGNEILTNGTFTGSATGWTLGSGYAYSSNSVSKTSNGTAALTQSFTGYLQREYLLTYTISNWTVGTVTPSVGGFTGTAVSANGTYTERFVATATTQLAFTPSNTARFTIDSVSLKSMIGTNTASNLNIGGLSVEGNWSNSSPGTTRHTTINNDGTYSWTDYRFAGVLRSSFGPDSTGNVNMYASGGNYFAFYGGNSGLTSNTLFSYNYPSGFVHSADGRFGNAVHAGSQNAGTSTLQSAGGLALKVTRITASQTLDNTATHWLCDATNASACAGTPSAACSSWGNQSDCEKWDAHGGCTWNAGTSCSVYDNEVGMGSCSGTGGCTAVTEACSGGDQTTCEAGDDVYGGSCSWGATGDCSALDEGTCNSYAGQCTTNYSNCVWADPDCTGGAACDAGDGTDQATCEAITYFSSCSGNYNVCSGTYFTGSCTGTFGASCSGTSTCSGINDSTNCGNETGCTWSSVLNVTMPVGTSYPDRTYFIQNDASNGADTVLLPETTTNPVTTINKASSYTLGNYKDGVHVAYYAITANCSGLSSQGSCEAQNGCTWSVFQCSDYNGTDQSTCETGHTGCAWSDPSCNGTWGSCSGTYYTSKDWAVYTDNQSASGTYTPTLTNTTNIGASTARLATYMRVGNTVTVAGQLDIDPTATGAVLLGISLPIASNFSTAYQLGGVGSSTAIANESYGIEADATNDRASMKNIAVSTANHTVTYTFTYQLL